MMQNKTSLTPVQSEAQADLPETAVPALSPDRVATVWVSRVTSVVGLTCLIIALGVWLGRPGHYRFVLAMLTIAMFAAILHSYTFENGG